MANIDRKFFLDPTTEKFWLSKKQPDVILPPRDRLTIIHFFGSQKYRKKGDIWFFHHNHILLIVREGLARKRLEPECNYPLQYEGESDFLGDYIDSSTWYDDAAGGEHDIEVGILKTEDQWED